MIGLGEAKYITYYLWRCTKISSLPLASWFWAQRRGVHFPQSQCPQGAQSGLAFFLCAKESWAIGCLCKSITDERMLNTMPKFRVDGIKTPGSGRWQGWSCGSTGLVDAGNLIGPPQQVYAPVNLPFTRTKQLGCIEIFRAYFFTYREKATSTATLPDQAFADRRCQKKDINWMWELRLKRTEVALISKINVIFRFIPDINSNMCFLSRHDNRSKIRSIFISYNKYRSTMMCLRSGTWPNVHSFSRHFSLHEIHLQTCSIGVRFEQQKTKKNWPNKLKFESGHMNSCPKTECIAKRCFWYVPH